MSGVRDVPWWGIVSSAAAPVLLGGGWTVAARLQPGSYDPVTDTVSALAALGAADRWVMTLTFVTVGVCEFVTGLALRPAGILGRLVLMAGAVAGMLVAASPEHEGSGGPPWHAVWGTVGLSALAAWPAGAWRRGSAVPWALRPSVAIRAAVVFLALLGWFGAELFTGAGLAGLAERVLGAVVATWPFVVALSCRHPVTAGRRLSAPCTGAGDGP